MPKQPRPEVKAPPIHLKKQLIVSGIVIFVIGIAVILAGKVIFGGLVSLLGAVFGLGAQVVRDIEL